MIIYLPYAGSHIPADMIDEYLISASAMEREAIEFRDPLAEQLFIAEKEDEIPIKNVYSRLVFDPTKYPNDDDEWSRNGLGVIHTVDSQGRKIKENPSRAEAANIINHFYTEHHKMVLETVDNQLAEKGYCIILELKTHPNRPWESEPNKLRPRPHFMVGTHPFHTPRWMQDYTRKVINNSGFNAMFNKPYEGCFIPLAHHSTTPEVMCISISVNRGLYCRPSTSQRTSGFGLIHRTIYQLKQIYRKQAEQLIKI